MIKTGKIEKIMKKKLSIITLGCPKNVADSDKMINILSVDFYITNNPEEAEIILLNTCGFLQESLDEMFDFLNKLEILKINKPDLFIVVFGCGVTRLINKRIDLKSRFSFVNHFIHIDKINHIRTLLSHNFTINPLVLSKKHCRHNIYFSKIRKNIFYGYIKISDGCNRRCSFCTIPNIKGKYVSIPVENIIKQAKVLSQTGIQEIILIGQETTNYGFDINSSLYELLDELSQIERLKWIRIMYAHPLSFDLNILNLMNERDNICKYIDIPLQHASSYMLQAMNRRSYSGRIKKLIGTIREIVPEIRIRSTFITGFPGETEHNHNLLLKFLSEYKLDRVGVFKYSKETGTSAYNFPNQVPEEIKEQRFNELMSLQQSISLDNNQKMIGKTIKVLIEADFDNDYFIGRSEFDAPDVDNSVYILKEPEYILKEPEIKVGTIRKCKVYYATEYDLYVKLDD